MRTFILNGNDSLFQIEKILKGKKVSLVTKTRDEKNNFIETSRYKQLHFSTEDAFLVYMAEKEEQVTNLFSEKLKKLKKEKKNDEYKVVSEEMKPYISYLVLFDAIQNMTIGLYNRKGGVGKSLITYLFSKAFDFKVKDVDPNSTLSIRLDNVDEVDSDETIVIPTSGKWIIDYASKAYHKEREQFQEMDVLVIPTGVFEDIAGATEMMLHDFKEVEVPILFAFNKVEERDEGDVKKEFTNFTSFLPYGGNLGYLPDSKAVKTSLKKQIGIVELSTERGLVGSNNKNMAIKIIDLFIATLLTAEGEIKNG